MNKKAFAIYQCFNVFRSLIQTKENVSQIISQFKIGRYTIDRAIVDHSGIIGIELKPLIKLQGKKIILTKLSEILSEVRVQEQLQHYLLYPKMRFLVLTNLHEVFIFTKWNYSKDKVEPQIRLNFLDFVRHYLGVKRLKDLLVKYFKDYPVLELDQHFLKDLKVYWQEIDELIPDKKEKIKFINTLMMIRLLEDAGALPFGTVEGEWNRAKEYHGSNAKQRIKTFLENFVVDTLYEYYNTELLNWDVKTFIENYRENLDKILSSIGRILGYEGFDSIFFKGLKFYDFNAINEDIFGKAYESFLAELRKETGIFYTPAFITEYIAQKIVVEKFESIYKEVNLLINSLETEEPEKLYSKTKEIHKNLNSITILDPACGSGSFLVKVFKIIHLYYKRMLYLFEEKHRYYDNLHSKSGGTLFNDSELLEKISTLRKLKNIIFDCSDNNIYDFLKKMVTRHIFGVDIDPAALDIAKLNIWKELIKLEPDHYLIENVRKYGHHYVFPDLTTNFKNMDSILSSIDEWEKSFPEVFAQSGFSVVIGNPPYVRGENIEKSLRDSLRNMYPNLFLGHMDVYTAFIRRAVDLLKNEGILGFIVSNKWMRAKYGKPLRKIFIEEGDILELIDFSGYKVFKEATVDTVIVLFQKGIKSRAKFLSCVVKNDDFKNYINDNRNLFNYVSDKKVETDMTSLSEESFLFLSQKEYKLKEKIERIGKPLKDWDVNIYRGIKTGLNEAFIIDSKKREEILNNCKTADERRRTEAIIKPILRGRDIKRYYYEWAGLWVIFIPWHFPLHEDLSIHGASEKAEKEFQKQYPAIYNHLLQFKDVLSKRNKDETGIRYEWYALQRCAATYYPEFEKEKVVYSEIVREPQFYYDTEKFYVEATSFLMTGKNMKYLCGLLNSHPVTYFFKKWYAGGGLGEEGFRYKKAFLEQLPIPLIKNENKHFISQIESLVDQILTLKSQDCSTDTTELEIEIDKLVYELYELTPEEIEIIEQKSG
ncbi:N-6 DNA methylase [Thermodesulfovibrio sp. 1176]|uniref:Eco57I restriction-modification methylase domain-containing protein n=1 Tax=Thermodesulfovibrio sp. 1176 TaxID=3043424 RepID=UPI002482B5B0|nr:N-6 DNA methylase [Thermodesulfovibrio sp. 1176]MDI1471553.1 N-6 DNA methylase [Thermodesulfovibrio sp. 1176]